MTNTDDLLARVCQALEEDDRLYDDLYERLYDDEDEVDLTPLPVEPAKRGSLRQAIERGLQEHGCDHTLRNAEAWARHEKIQWGWLQNELEERGGYCDCEVVLNVLKLPDNSGG
jgi:hypothetical protein